MAQIRLLKISTEGIPREFDSASDEITLASFTVNGGGPVLSSTGLDMNNLDISDVQDLVFNSPSSGTINQTAGNLIVDNIMAKERSNVMTTAGDILFPVITDTAGQVDSFRLPALAGIPTASPTSGGEGYLVWNSSNDHLYAWTGSSWDDVSVAAASETVQNYYTADEALLARDVVYISAADNVSKAIATAETSSRVIGLAVAATADTDPVAVQSEGVMTGFSGLTAGSRYYLSTSAAGEIQSSVPSGSGNVIVQIGYAKSATALHLHIEQLGRRA